MPEFHFVCMEFEFKNYDDAPNSIIFVKYACLFELDFVQNKYMELHHFDPPFHSQPFMLKLNDNQDIYLAASEQDGYLYNSKTKK